MQRALHLENECAATLAAKGYRVHQNPSKEQIAEARLLTGDTGRSSSDPDYLIEGHVFDCYAPKPTRPVRGVWTAVNKKVTDLQTERVVLNLEDWQGDIHALQKQFDDWPVARLKELVAVTRDRSIVQLVRRD